jgi:hypothetical protein
MKIRWLWWIATLLLVACTGPNGLTAIPTQPSSTVSSPEDRPATSGGSVSVPQPGDLSPSSDVSASGDQDRLAEPATEVPTTGTEQSQIASTVPSADKNRRVGVDETYEKFPRLLPFDGIRPVYEPLFASAEDAGLTDDELVMGIALGGEAKAYPVSVLRFREMVNDEMAGIPTLVTW